MAGRVGQQLDAYRLIRQLGAGTFGEVYLGEHVYQRTQVAVKVLNIQLTSETLKSFLNEARTFRLKHPNIVQLLDFGSDSNTPFLIMDYAPNGTLRQRHPHGTRLPLEVILPYVKQVADALQYAHDNRLIHRDVKPQNMLLGSNDEVLLSDFGLAVFAHSEFSLSTQEMAGTVPYMAPEQFRGKPRPNSDQYSLGVTVYEWLCGAYPFEGFQWKIINQHLTALPPPLQEKVPTIKPEVDEVVLKALAKVPEKRFARVQDFAIALEEAHLRARQSNVITQSNKSSPVTASPSKPFAIRSETTSLSRPIVPLNFHVAQSKAVGPSKQPIPLKPPVSILPQGLVSSPMDTQLQQPAVPFDPVPSSQALLPSSLPVSPPPLKTAKSPREGLKNTITINIGLVFLLVIGILGVFGYINLYSPIPAGYGMFGYDLQHTRYNSYEHILSSTNISHLELDWTASTKNIIASSPTVVNGVVYIASYDGNLYAFDATNGNNIRTNSIGDASFSSPAIANGIVYIGSMDHNLYAFGSNKWEAMWINSTGDAIYSSPIVVNDVVYVGSFDGNLYAFDAIHGNILWTTSTGTTIFSSPAVANKIIYVGGLDGMLYAFNITSGKALWTAATGNALYSSPTVANGIVYIGSLDHSLYAFSATTGKTLWTASTGDIISSSPTVANGVVYVGSHDHKLYAFNAATGQTLWTASTGAAIYSSPTVANGVVYVGSFDGNLYAFHLPAMTT